MDWIEESRKEIDESSKVLSFYDYMELFNSNPVLQLRPTYQYLLDMINHFGQAENGSYKIFEQEHEDCPPVFGQQIPEQQIVQNLINFKEEGHNNKFILLVGPNGSAKSSIVRKIMQGAEDYSQTDDGALFTFSWIFPIDTYVKGTLGLASNHTSQNLSSYAYLEDKDISAILNSELKDCPFLLVPLKHRQQIIDENFEDQPELHDYLRKSYFYNGDLSKRNRMIYDALLKNYKGDHANVLKHIRVEKFNISRRYSSGAVTIEPQIHVDARLQQITMDRRLASLPPSLQSLNLFSMQGEIVMANRGLLEYSDLLKRPLDSYKYLLQTMETGNINLNGVLTQLDIFFIGTSNEIHMAAFKQHPDFNSFKGRFNFVRVPYLLNFKDEEKIYQKQVDSLKERCYFEPHALESICLFGVMTRLRASQTKNFENKKLANIITSLNPIEKSLILANDNFPERFDTESNQTLKQNLDKLRTEYEIDNLYEGKFGLSPRDIKNIIYKVSSKNKNLTFVDIIDYLQKLILKKNEYDFLNMTPQGDYHHPTRFVTLIKEYTLNQFDNELRESLGLVDDRSYETYIKRYIENVNAIIKGEKIKNQSTGSFEAPSEFFIKEFEKNINLKEDPAKFRSHLISKLGAWYLDHPSHTVNYMDVFPELVNLLQQTFRNEQKVLIENISKNLVFYVAERSEESRKTATPLSEENRKQIQTIVDNLIEKYKYSENGALTLIKYLIKERY